MIYLALAIALLAGFVLGVWVDYWDVQAGINSAKARHPELFAAWDELENDLFG